LSAVAVDVLERVTAGGPFPKRGLIFVNARGGALSDMAMAMLVRGMARDGLAEDDPPRWRDLSGDVVVPHGFRSSFRDWCGETRSEGREVAEQALAHMVRGVEAAYARSDLLERRRPLMQAWSKLCAGGTGAVVELADRHALPGPAILRRVSGLE
jgi:integrase